jgi:hypothetical protein
MARALLTIGCSEYDDGDSFCPLPGADTDAERVFGTLVERTGHYDRPLSKKLISPTLAEVRSALKDLYDLKDVDVLSFFFAGHGATEGGIYYLCPKDALGERLPVTALPISEVLAALAHVRPRQVNLVMDSCESGGAMLDMASLLKVENLVGPESPNVSFLAASAPDQSSYGDPVKGGFATTALMTYLDGDKHLRSDRPFLDLVELGRKVSENVGDTVQRPVAWGINLYGEDQFAENPFYEETAGRPPLPVALAPSTAAGATVRKYAEPLWRHYLSLPTDPAYGDMAELLRSACKDLEEVGTSSAAFMRGVASTLRDRAELSDDPLAPSDALACCLIVLLPLVEKEEVAALARELLAEKRELDSAVCKEVAEHIRSDRFAFLNSGVVLADFFLLPIRVSRVLGWLSAGVLTDHLLGASDDESIQSHTELATLVAETYRDSLVAMSDEQAPQVYLFAKACQILGEEVLAHEVLSAYFASFEDVDGFVAMVQASPQEAFRYLVARMHGQPGSLPGVTANPAEFLPALLLSGSHLRLGDVWNPRLRTFDGRIIGFFIPADHKEFGAPRIPTGTNRWPRVGHDIWTLQQLAEWFKETVAPAVSGDPSLRLVETKPLCVLASYLLADRLPYFLE